MAFFSETSQTSDVNKERTLYLEPMEQSSGELNVNGAKIRFIKQKDGVFVELQDGQKIQMKEGDVLVVSKDGKYTVIRPENREEVISRLLENGYSVMIWHRNELYRVSFDKDANRAVAKLNGNNVENLTAGVRKNEDAYQKWREGERDSVRLKDVKEEYRKLSFDQRLNLFETARKITLGKSEMSEEQRKILESLREDIAKLRSLGLSEQEILNRYFGSEHGKIIYDLYNMQKKLYGEKKYDFDTYVAALLMSLGAKTTNNSHNQNTSTQTSYESQEQVVATLNREGKATVNIDGVEISISYVKDRNGLVNMQAVLEQKVDKESVWLSEVQRLSLDQLKELDAKDGKLDGVISLEIRPGSRTYNIKLSYDEKGDIYLVMNDGQRVKMEQGGIIAINGDTGRYTLIKPVDPKISPAHTIHNLMGKGWHALYFDNRTLYYSSLNPEAAIARANGNFEHLKQLKGRDLRDFELKIGDRPVGYADWRAQERSISQSQENGQIEEKIIENKNTTIFYNNIELNNQQVKNVEQSRTQQESRPTVPTSLNTGTSFKPKTQQEAGYNKSSMADYRDRIYQEYRQGERNLPSAIVEQNRNNQISSSNQAVSSEQVSSGKATTKKLDNQQDKTTNDQLHDITGSKYQANLLEGAYHALSRRYSELTFEAYIELVKKHFSDPNNNFVDSYRALMKEVYEKYGKKEAVEERGGTSD